MPLKKVVSRLRSWEERLSRWEQGRPGRKRQTYWIVYTLCFVVVSCLALLAYPLSGSSLAWSVDGLEQYYPFFVYTGRWVRTIVEGLVAGQGLQIPLWDSSLGYGADIPSVIDVIYNPFYLLSALCPERYSEYFFQFLVVARMYLAGAAFSLLARHRGNGRFATLCGALIYALCGTAISAVLWPDGINPMILFPLLLVGVEKIFTYQKPYLFIVSLAFFFITSYYFAYMACLLLLLYCGFRVFVIERRRGNSVTPKLFVRWTVTFLGYLVVGILLAGIVLVPSLCALLSLDRVVEGSVAIPLLYSADFYQRTLAGFLGSSSVGSDCFIGFGGVAVLSCFVLFIKRKQNRNLKVMFVALTVILLLPFLGSVFNGFNYATNRWVWAYALCVAYIVVKVVPLLPHLSRREIKALCVCAGLYALLLFLLPGARTEWSMAALAVMLVSLIFLTWKGLDRPVWRYGLVVCVAAGLICNTFYFTAPEEMGWARTSPAWGSMYAKLTQDTPNRLIADIDDDSAWRYDADPTVGARPRNSSLVLDINGFDFYNSVYENNIDRFHTELGLTDTQMNFSYTNLGGRPVLDTLNGVKYYLIPNRASEKPPYNFSDHANIVAQAPIGDTPYTVYKANNALPLGFTYEHSISRDTYDALTPLQKQESLLQGVVVDDSSLPEASLDLSAQEAPYTVTKTDGLTFEEGKIDVSRPNATLTLRVEGEPEVETYLYFDHLAFEATSPLEKIPEKKRAILPWYRQASLFQQTMTWSAPNEYRITMQANNGAGVRTITNFADNSHLYGGKNTWLSNLGYATDAQNSVTLTFSQAGEYCFDDLAVLCQPMANFNQQVDSLKETVLEDVVFGTNQVTGSIDIPQRKALYLSIPYSTGWTAYVDGKQTLIKRANTAFMALELDPGHHDIKLVYVTPGLVEGAILSSIGLGLCAVIVVGNVAFDRRKRRLNNDA